MTVTAIIGLGSNLEDPQNQIKQAIVELSQLSQTCLIKTSSLYSTKPVGPQDQPNFINAVAEIETNLSAHELLDGLQLLEQKHRRIRNRHWGPRTLDLDLLFYGNENISTQRLTVPHPEILNRAFVVIPLLEIFPQFILNNNEKLCNYLKNLPLEDVIAIKKIKDN
jgi:2-amino-4-hydroxy-6-hydroxymethyldihydropteridine diphosphokinase